MPPTSKSRLALPSRAQNGSEPLPGDGAGLASRIQTRIERRLGDRIRDLQVFVAGKNVTLQGCCATYYSKQLAQHAALGVLEDERLENDICVGLVQ